MDYVFIALVFLGAVLYLIYRFNGILKGKKDMGCFGCDKACPRAMHRSSKEDD